MIPGYDGACESVAILSLEEGIFEKESGVVLNIFPTERLAVGNDQVQAVFVGKRQVIASFFCLLRRAELWGGDKAAIIIMKDIVGSEGVDLPLQILLFRLQASDCGPISPVLGHYGREWVEDLIE